MSRLFGWALVFGSLLKPFQFFSHTSCLLFPELLPARPPFRFGRQESVMGEGTQVRGNRGAAPNNQKEAERRHGEVNVSKDVEDAKATIGFLLQGMCAERGQRGRSRSCRYVVVEHCL